MHRAQTRSLECDAAFRVPAKENIGVGVDSSVREGVEEQRLHQADVAWRSLITTRKSAAFGIVERTESPMESLWEAASLLSRGRIGEQRRLQRE